MEAVKQNSYAIQLIKNPSAEAQMVYLSRVPEIVSIMRNPELNKEWRLK
jgi:hypothetical protein